MGDFTQKASEIFKYSHQLNDSDSSSRPLITSIKELKQILGYGGPFYSLFIKDIGKKKHKIVGFISNNNVSIRSSFNIKNLLEHFKNRGATVAIDKSNVLHVMAQDRCSVHNFKRCKICKKISSLSNPIGWIKLSGEISKIGISEISAVEVNDYYCSTSCFAGHILNLFNEESSKNIPVSEESWPKLKRCTVCKREFKEFPNTVPSDVCSLQCKAHADLDFSTTL